MESARIGFRRLQNSDLPTIHLWLHTPHVARWWHEDTIDVCIIDPNPENTAAIRAYEKVGFEHFKSAVR